MTVPTEIPGFTWVNYKYARQVNGNAKLSLAVENVFGVEAQDLLFYPRPGRWVTATLSGHFQHHLPTARPLGGAARPRGRGHPSASEEGRSRRAERGGGLARKLRYFAGPSAGPEGAVRVSCFVSESVELCAAVRERARVSASRASLS